MTDKSIPPCQFGYLTLTNDDGNPLLIKANKITAIDTYLDDSDIEFIETHIYTSESEEFHVSEPIEQILTLLEAIHPSLR